MLECNPIRHAKLPFFTSTDSSRVVGFDPFMLVYVPNRSEAVCQQAAVDKMECNEAEMLI